MSFSEQDLQELKAESLELLDAAEKSLLALDQGAKFGPNFDSVFRAFHNIKGASGMMEQTRLESHTHQLESLLMEFKTKGSIPKNYLNLFLRGIDASRAILDGEEVTFNFNPESSAPESAAPKQEISPKKEAVAVSIPDSALSEFVSECEEISDRVAKNLLKLESGTHNSETLNDFFRDVHSLKGSSYLFSFNKLGDLAHGMESSLEPIRNGSDAPPKSTLELLFQSVKCIESMVASIRSKVPAPELESLASELARSLTNTESAPKTTHPQPGTSKTETAQRSSSPIQTKEKEPEGSGTIRVPVDLLDNLMTLMGEMVLVRNQVLQFSNQTEDPAFLSMSKRLNVVTSEIQGEMMKTRMQPIGNITGKFTRVVRDLSQELKKNIQLNSIGAETELDKSLLEAIKDPLTHIVRNSCDHGIETPEVRRASGKSDTGTITIKAYHEGGQVVIDVLDDGKGLHPEVLVKKAIEKGILTQAQATKLSEKETFNLIFAPGFSTAASITNVSGRGVGMDVVRTNIERIGGTIELASKPGAGTAIKMRIPLTLAIVPALVVKSGGGTYAIPQVKLEELVRVDQSSGSENRIEILHGTPVYRLRGNILPLLNLNAVLARTGSESLSQEIVNIAVLNSEQGSFGLIIDEVQDTADIVVKPINRLLKTLQVYSGATILGDGSVALILDVPGLAKTGKLGMTARETENSSQQAADANRARTENQDFLLVRLSSPTKHAIPLSYVNRLEEFKRESIEISGSQRVIRYGSSILPLISVNRHLGYVENQIESRDTLPVVVIQRAGGLYGIEVDAILDTLSTQTDVDSSLISDPCIFGNLNTKEELVVVLDPFELISREFPQIFKKSLTEEHAQPVFTPARSSTASPLKILLVEDTAFFRKAIRIVLEKSGFEVHAANDGQEAIEILNKRNTIFDMVISDIEMPRMNGFQLAEAIRQHPDHSRLPLLAVSSRADRDYVLEGKKAGFDIYLEKLKPNLLLGAITELTSKDRSAA